MRKTFSFFLLVLASSAATGEWVKIAENNRSVAYVDTDVKRTGDLASYWVLFDYKTEQVSSTSGRRYWSEKSQRETECSGERSRVMFFTWHSEKIGFGEVVYTGNKPFAWEPSSSPGSYGNAFWKYVCRK